MECQDLMKKSGKLRAVLRTTVAENVKMESDNQTVLKVKEQVTSMTTKLTAGQGSFRDLSRYWQSEADKMQRRIDWMASENE
jgi:hypothetical protein